MPAVRSPAVLSTSLPSTGGTSGGVKAEEMAGVMTGTYACCLHHLSFSGRRPSYLEQSYTTRHDSTVTGHLSQLPQNSSLQALLSMTSLFSCRAREVTCHYGHVNRFCYLLTYLLSIHTVLLEYLYRKPK